MVGKDLEAQLFLGFVLGRGSRGPNKKGLFFYFDPLLRSVQYAENRLIQHKPTSEVPEAELIPHFKRI